MRDKFLKLFITFIYASISISAFSQVNDESKKSVGIIIDSLKNSGVILNGDHKKPVILLSTSEAVKFLQEKYQLHYWKDTHDPLRLALGQLIFEASHPRFDSSKYVLKTYPYDSLSIPWDKFYIWEPLRLKIPVISPRQFPVHADSTVISDTNLAKAVRDSMRLKSFALQNTSAGKQPIGLKDTTIMVVIDTLNEVTSSVAGFPFRYFSYPYEGDSIKVAVNSLLKYLEDRDSTIINFTGIGNSIIPVWLNSKSDRVMRYWLKNEFSDSVTVWIDSPSRNTIGLYLEKGVNFRRPIKQGNYSDAKINVQSIDNSKLLEIKKIFVKPQYWKFHSEASFVLSQAALSNWVRGGENSISTALDITDYANYKNKALKISSDNFVRLKLGFLKSGGSPLRKNLDLIETNSKLNHLAFGKVDFSAIMLFKTQIAAGYDYALDPPRLVSKFLNPATLIIGLGLDYKPNKTTSLNFSPLSYKGTFVTDTAHIDQTLYGIPHNRKSLNEPGVSFLISNEFRPTKKIDIINRLQLFTNYIHNPQNVDVDWEMIAVANLNWFTDIRFNTHLIYDDDEKTVVLDSNKNPVLNPDGTVKKSARAQFKEILGISLVFRF